MDYRLVEECEKNALVLEHEDEWIQIMINDTKAMKAADVFMKE